jgi:hypothetical protein
MQGVKYKIAHKRPYWQRWNTEYPDNESEHKILIRILEQYLAELKAEIASYDEETKLHGWALGSFYCYQSKGFYDLSLTV